MPKCLSTSGVMDNSSANMNMLTLAQDKNILKQELKFQAGDIYMALFLHFSLKNTLSIT